MFEKIISRGILTAVILLIVCVVGILAATKIPVQMIPDLDVRVISIRTVWPGATPQDVEKEILVEQEEYLRNLPSLSRIISTARAGRAEIELEFPFGTDITEMMIRVNNALSQVPSYPETVDEPAIYANSFSANAFMFFSIIPLPGNERQVDIDMMKDYVEDNVKTLLSRVPGVSEIGVYGGAEKQVQVLVDPAKLAQRNLSLTDLRQAIRLRNRNFSGGELDSGKRQYLLRTIGQFDTIESLEETILARRGDSIIRLGDVASVKLSLFEKDVVSRYNGQTNLFVTVRREPGANVLEIKRAMIEQVKIANEDFLQPNGMQMHLLADDVQYVSDSIANVWRNLVLGALLATAVMFLFLRSWKATVIGVMGIPVCIIVAFLGLLVGDRTINVISLAGIAFAIGMTLDNSIVVLESIEVELRRGADRMKAAIQGVRQVWPAVLASTMTTVLVFLPVIFVTGEAGQLYSDIAIAISAAILGSMLVAITALPTAAARVNLVVHKNGESKLGQRARKFGESCSDAALAAVASITRTRGAQASCIAVVTLLSAGIIAFMTPPAEYLPEGEEPKVFAMMSAPPGYNLSTMESIAEDINRYFLRFVNNNPAEFRRSNTPVPALKYVNMRIDPQQIRIITEPVDAADMEPLMNAIARKYEAYPGMRAFVTRGSIITSNDGGSRSINLDISGPNLGDLFSVARSAYARATEIFEQPRIQTSPSALTLAQPMIEIRPRWERIEEEGFNAESLGFTVAALTDGSFIDEFFLADKKIDIYVYSSAGQAAKLDGLQQLAVYTPAGNVLPLSNLVDIVETVDTGTLRRVNGNRTVTLNIIPPRDVPLETGVARVRNQLVEVLRERGEIPAGVNIGLSGAADQLDATRSALGSNYLVALLIIYLLLVAIFSHWGYPLLIMTAIPLGLAGGLVGLWLLNAMGQWLPLLGAAPIVQPFDMISMLGFLILMGTVVNNPILVVDRAVFNVTKLGMSARDAVLEAVRLRLRPIAMSTLTTIFGLAPLVLVPGAGTELYRGVGAIVMAGILGAAIVSLTLLPALAVLVLELRGRALARFAD